jgi:hypothetical protein
VFETNNFITVFQFRFITLWEGQRQTVNENIVLRNVYKPKREEITEDCRKLHNERFHDFYSSRNIKRVTKSRKARQAEHVTVMEDKWNVCIVLEGKPEKQGQHGRQWSRLKDNTKMDLTKFGWEDVNWNILSKRGPSGKLLWTRQWTLWFHEM